MAKAEAKLDWLPEAQAALNADPAFRKLGSTDLTLGLVIGDTARLVTFEAFRITAVSEAGPAQLRDADIVIDMPVKDWNSYLRARAAGKGESLLSLDLERRVVRGPTPLKRLLLERYNLTLQALLDRGSGLPAAN